MAFDPAGFQHDAFQVALVVAVLLAIGKYKPEHDSALIDIAASHGFAAEHGSAVTDIASATGFSNEHAGALKDIGDAGV